MLYILNNENTHKIKIVTLVEDESEVPANLATDINVLDRAYPDFVVEFIIMKGKFSPQLIDELSVKWNIPKNFMFIGSPGYRFPYHISTRRRAINHLSKGAPTAFFTMLIFHSLSLLICLLLLVVGG